MFVRLLCCVCGVLLESYGRIGELLLIFINSIDHNGSTLHGRGACNMHIHAPIMAMHKSSHSVDLCIVSRYGI